MKNGQPIAVELIERRIYLLRGHKIMLDRDLAELYGVDTRTLNQAVRRNIDRFPEDFMFALDREEIMRISQIVISSDIKFSKSVLTFTQRFLLPGRPLPHCALTLPLTHNRLCFIVCPSQSRCLSTINKYLCNGV
jgi:hypothetical protein